MTTMTLPAPTVKATHTTRKPAHDTCKLTLSISGTDYRLRAIPCEDSAELKAWRLRKADGTAYDVVETLHGHECTCPDWVFSRDGIDPAGCKHIKALVAVGLLGAPSPKGGHVTPTLGTAEGTQQASTPGPAPTHPVSTTATVDALDWAHAICGKLWDVAEPAQRTFAVAIMNCDSGMYFQRRITPGGPSLEELRARLAGRTAENVTRGHFSGGVGSTDTLATAEGVNSTDTPEDVRSTDTPAHDRMSDGELPKNISEVQPAPCCPAAEPVPCKACAADGWASTDEIDRFTWTISGGLTGHPEPATDEELEGFDPDNLTFREIPEADPIGPDEGFVPPEDDRPEEDDSAPRLSVAEWIRREADRYTTLGTAAADLVAETLHSLARGFDRVGASTVEQYKDRWAAIEAPGV